MTSIEGPALVASPGQATSLDTAEELPLYRRAARIILDVSRILVVWWYATLPAVLIWYGFGSATIAATLWLVIVVGSRWLPPVELRPFAGLRLLRWFGVRVDHRHSVHRSAEVWYRLWWPRKAKGAALVGPVGGYHRSPKLLRYERDLTRLRPAWQMVRIKPLPTQRRDSWPLVADQLMRYLDQADVEVEVDDRNHLTMWLTAAPLPTMAPLPIDRVAQTEDFVLLGTGVGGREFGWRPDVTPHLTVTGITRGGKGVAVRNMEAHAVRCGWEIDRANPKGRAESDWLKSYASMATTMPGMWAQAAAVLEEFERRKSIIETLGVDNWTSVRDQIGRRRLYIIDEGNNFIGAQNKGEDKDLLVLSSWIVTRLAAMAAFVGVH
ncbi:MAG: hypothetical protein AAGK32_17515, partial [Actinomycetota bacterium]